MKKALVMTFVLVLGLGAAAFAAPLAGTWDMTISIDPGATLAGDLFIDLSTSLALEYTIAGWVFGSSSTFDTIGWSAQSFTASGILGAFSFSSTLNFKPRTVDTIVWNFNNAGDTALQTDIATLAVAMVAPSTIAHFSECWVTDEDYVTKTYGAAFDDWTATGSVSIAGVTFEGLFFLEGYAGDDVADPYAFYTATGTLSDLVQTSGDTAHYLGAPATKTTLGSGSRLMISGTAGALSITSYTYFNLVEDFEEADCGWSLAKEGEYTIASEDCDVTFTEEYIHISGFSIGCAEFAAGLDITCAGFNWVAFEATGLDLGFCCPGITVDFGIKFSETEKELELCAGLELRETCFDFGISLDYADYTIGGFSIDSIGFEHTWNGITFSSETLFGSYSSTITDDANQILFMVPVEGLKDSVGTVAVPAKNIASVDDTDASGYYDAVCVYTEKYEVWESFTIEVDGDSCCGGLFDFSVTTSFGTKFELDAWAYDYQFDNDGASPTVHNTGTYLALEAGDTVPTLADIVGGDANGDGIVDIINYLDTVWAATATNQYAEQLLTGTVYDEATSDQLFQWVSTDVDLSIGLGSAWSLTFGLDIAVYGWNALSFGFEFTF